MEEEKKEEIKYELMARTLYPGTVVDITTVTDGGPVVKKGKIKMILDGGQKKYLVHIKNTELKFEVYDIKVDDGFKPPYTYISGAYDKYGRPIE